jgi:hypothetical protein
MNGVAAMDIFLVLLVSGIIIGAFASTVAKSKNLDGSTWFMAGLFFSLLGVIAAAGMAAKTPEQKAAEDKAEKERIAAYNVEVKETGPVDSEPALVNFTKEQLNWLAGAGLIGLLLIVILFVVG